MLFFEVNIVRYLLEKIFKLYIKLFDNFILFLFHFSNSQQQQFVIFFSIPYFYKGLFKFILGLNTLSRETIVPSPSIIHKSGGDMFHHKIFSIITHEIKLEKDHKLSKCSSTVATS
jgi:hypothetical protein